MGVWHRSIARKEGIWQQNINATRSKNLLKSSLSSYLVCRMMGSLSSFVWYDDFKSVSNQPNEYIDQDVLTKFNVWQAVQENRLNPFSLIAKKRLKYFVYCRPGAGRMSISDVRGHGQGPGQDRSLPSHTQERSRAKSRSRGLADIDPKFISQVR